ncbi:hypothetical protein CO659_29140 [Rhizobium sp. S9]|nr:hypothetical protein CO659_29140 [Rhizobium sp. S9]
MRQAKRSQVVQPGAVGGSLAFQLLAPGRNPCRASTALERLRSFAEAAHRKADISASKAKKRQPRLR